MCSDCQLKTRLLELLIDSRSIGLLFATCSGGRAGSDPIQLMG
jgi:hypothetical protein